MAALAQLSTHLGMPWAAVIWVVVAYFAGALPVGLVVGRLAGVDLRTQGSGNVGATNATRTLGPKLGVLVLLLDVAKAAVPTLLASRALSGVDCADAWSAGVAFAAVCGHVFPVFTRFRGGKGVACALGAFAALQPLFALGGLALYATGLLLTRTSGVGSLMAVTGIAVFGWLAGLPLPDAVLATAIAALVWLRHRDNLRRLRRDDGPKSA